MELRILVVDDERHLRTTLADILREEGYQVDTAATGEEAIQLCDHNAYDVLLLDVRMPGVNGVEIFRHIQQCHAEVRVILMSAYSLDASKQQALAEGAIAFLTKPLDIQNLLHLIREVKESAILIVAEDTTTTEMMREVLKRRGYRVTSVYSAYDALELLAQLRFDIIFIDVRLSAMNGLECYLAIKRLSPTAIAIMLSDGEEAGLRVAHEAVRHAAYALLEKPLDVERMLAVLQQATRQRVAGYLMKPPLDVQEPRQA